MDLESPVGIWVRHPAPISSGQTLELHVLEVVVQGVPKDMRERPPLGLKSTCSWSALNECALQHIVKHVHQRDFVLKTSALR